MVAAGVVFELFLLLLVWPLVAWIRIDRRHIMYLVAGIGTAAGCVFFLVHDFGVLSRDLTVLQAGLSDLNIAHVFGRGNHFCTTCEALPATMRALGSHALPIQDAVLINRVLFFIDIAALATLALTLSGNFLLSVFFAVGAATVPVVSIGFDTNYPAPFLMFLLLSGVLCGAVFREKARTGHVAAAMSVGALAMATILAFLTRPETATVGVAALFALALEGRRLPAIPRPRTWFRPVLFAVIVMVALKVLSIFLARTDFPVWVIDGINPLDPSTVTSVIDLVVMLPLSMAALVFIGLWVTGRRPVFFLLVPVTLIFLLKTAASASRFDFHTIFRMFSVITPMLLVAGAWGLGAASGWMSARIPDARIRFILTVIIIASFTVGTPFARRTTGVERPSGGYVSSLEQPDSMLSMNPQLEVRFLVQALDSHPDCLFRSRVIDSRDYHLMNSDGHAGRGVDVWFSRAGVSYSPPDNPPSCVLLYRSLDCSLAGQDVCQGMLDGATPVREVSFSSRPYGDYLLVDYDNPVVLGLYLPAHQP